MFTFLQKMDVQEEISQSHIFLSLFLFSRQAVPFYDFSSGKLVEPAKPNGHKFEMFVFDVFFLAKKLVALEVRRDEEVHFFFCISVPAFHN